jgi:predicted site-specific integrase-resolvase
VAKLVKVNRTTIYRWIRDEKVKAIAFNGNFFVEWDSVSAFMGPIAAVLNLPDKSTGNVSV